MKQTYERIADVIRYLDTGHIDQPDLAVLAQRAGLSPFHFHRLFSNWAAVTPKDFLQCLTVSHAKALLKKGASVLDASLETGLSGPGRLHDLLVHLEAASPGEMKTGGAGLTISFGFTDSPFGRSLIGESPRGICHLSFVTEKGDPAALAELRKNWLRARLERNDAAAARTARQVFQRSPGSPQAPLRAFVRGTDFQVRVWRALLQIPAGTLTTYGRIAEALNQPAAARAVGSAVGSNLIGFLIPCHRVIRNTGVVGDYRWGTVRKRAMLAGRTPRMADAYQRIYAAVNKIPKGRVATYGQIARLAGLPGHARQVGYALSALSNNSVAWHRVVNSQGRISGRSAAPPFENEQRIRLQKEKVVFDSNDRISLRRFQWKIFE